METEEITFDTLPKAVNIIIEAATIFNDRLINIERLLSEKPTNKTPEDDILTVPQAAELLGIEIQSIYNRISKRTIPFMKPPGSKRVMFSKTELLEYLKSSRRRTNAEIEADVDAHLRSKKRSRQ